MFYELASIAKNYAWGTPGALSRFTGASDSNLPEAELWFGDHASSQCTITVEGTEQSLASWLSTTGNSFPLLVKLLAASQPLSIQVHPNAEDAKWGFARENAEGIALDDPKRTYKDTFAKPELIVALSETFEALWGFVPASVIRQRIAALEAGGVSWEVIETLTAHLGESVEGFVRWALSGDPGLSAVISEIEQWAHDAVVGSSQPESALDASLVAKLSQHHSGDAGILFALVMHHVSLDRGQALFVNPGEVHAYVEGFGLEVMMPSDNVVRAGLSAKHIDVGAFLEFSQIDSRESPGLVQPQASSVGLLYSEFPAPFDVVAVDSSVHIDLDAAPALVIVESGSAVLVSDEKEYSLSQGVIGLATGSSLDLAPDEGGHVWVVRSQSLPG